MLRSTRRAGNARRPALQHVLDLKGQRLQAGLALRPIARMRQHLRADNWCNFYLTAGDSRPRCLPRLRLDWWSARVADHHYYTLQLCAASFTLSSLRQPASVPRQCPSCGPRTYATGWVRDGTTGAAAPSSRRADLTTDRDTTSRKARWSSIWRKFYRAERAFLLGTHTNAGERPSLPDVTLVALLDVDGALFSADCSAERFAQPTPAWPRRARG